MCLKLGITEPIRRHAMSKLAFAFVILASASLYDPKASMALLGPLGPYVTAAGDFLKKATNVNTVMPGLRLPR
jgi:hypothetical protein